MMFSYMSCFSLRHDCRSAILNDVAMSSARNRQHVTKTLLVLGECVNHCCSV